MILFDRNFEDPDQVQISSSQQVVLKSYYVDVY